MVVENYVDITDTTVHCTVETIQRPPLQSNCLLWRRQTWKRRNPLHWLKLGGFTEQLASLYTPGS